MTSIVIIITHDEEDMDEEIYDILDEVLDLVMTEAVEPWSEYVCQTSVIGSTEDQYMFTNTSDEDVESDTDEWDEEMSDIDCGELDWDDVNISSQPEDESLPKSSAIR